MCYKLFRGIKQIQQYMYDSTVSIKEIGLQLRIQAFLLGCQLTGRYDANYVSTIFLKKNKIENDIAA